MIFYTSNGGLNWQEYVTIPSQSLNEIAFANQNTGWVVGDYGEILKTTTGGVTAVENQTGEILHVPTEYYLSQNYPNPFNPTTTIKYQLPKIENRESVIVQLKIYNILGREVAALVNEKQKPGSYEVVWDASEFSSGVYFYQLFTKDFQQSRKLMLLK